VIANKAKGQQNRVAKPEPLAFAYSCPCSSARIERPPTKPRVLSSNLAQGTVFGGPACSANYWRGPASGEPKAEFVGLTVILDFRLEESKVQSDLPFVQNRDGEGWTWAEQCPALEVPTMRQAIL